MDLRIYYILTNNYIFVVDIYTIFNIFEKSLTNIEVYIIFPVDIQESWRGNFKYTFNSFYEGEVP